MLEVDVAKKELADRKQLEASKLQLHGELKRKIALETMLNTLDVSMDIVNCVVFEIHVVYWSIYQQAEQQHMEVMAEKEKIDRDLAVWTVYGLMHNVHLWYTNLTT